MKNIYKLMTNNVYGKLGENPRNRTQAYLVRTEDQLFEQTTKLNFQNYNLQSFKIFNEDLAAAVLKKLK